MKKLLFACACLIALPTASQAADLAVSRAAAPAPVFVGSFNWTGFYIGAHAGYTRGSSTFTDTDRGGSAGVWNAPGDRFTATRSGLAVGAQAGYNYQINSLVIGVEADLGYLGGSASRSSVLAVDTRGETKGGIYATARGRLGFAVDKALFFVTAGVIGVDAGARINDTTPPTLTTDRSGFRAGWTVGGGLEYAIARNWTLKADYLYYDLGGKLVSGQQDGVPGAARNFAFDASGKGHIARLGVNYLFSTGPSAVMARY
jgi:outer membrane immunogenic protein